MTHLPVIIACVLVSTDPVWYYFPPWMLWQNRGMWSRRNSVCSESRPKAFDMSSGIPDLPITSWSVDNIYNRVLCCKSISINYDMHGWLLRLCRSFCGCPQRGAAPYRDCFLDLRLFNSPDLRRVGLCYCCQAWTLETVLGGNTALTRWWTARSIDADEKR